jgi:hypothetical protein
VLGQSLVDGQADPPHRIGNKFEPPGFIKALDRFEQADIAFGDPLDEREVIIPVLAGDTDHKAQISRDQGLARFFVASSGLPETLDLFLAAQGLGFTDIAPVDIH